MGAVVFTWDGKCQLLWYNSVVYIAFTFISIMSRLDYILISVRGRITNVLHFPLSKRLYTSLWKAQRKSNSQTSLSKCKYTAAGISAKDYLLSICCSEHGTRKDAYEGHKRQTQRAVLVIYSVWTLKLFLSQPTLEEGKCSCPTAPTKLFTLK